MSKLIRGFGKKGAQYAGRGEEFKYWKRYVEREKIRSTGAMWFKPMIGFRRQGRSKWYYDENRSWTRASQEKNKLGQYVPRVLVEPVKEQFIFAGDRVEVLVGTDKGKQGEIIDMIPERNWCFVEGLHQKYSNVNMDSSVPGYGEKKEMPLLITSEVTLVDPADQKPTEIEWRYTENGERVRVSIRSGRIIPIPQRHKGTWEDYTKADVYKDAKKDTADDELKKATYVPKLCSFDQDVIEKAGMKYEPRKKRTFWY